MGGVFVGLDQPEHDWKPSSHVEVLLVLPVSEGVVLFTMLSPSVSAPLWMDEILHHELKPWLKPEGLLVFTAKIMILGFLGWCRISAIHSITPEC